MAVKSDLERAVALRRANEEAQQQKQADREAEEAERGKLESVKASLNEIILRRTRLKRLESINRRLLRML